MRIGLVDRVDTDGELVQVFVLIADQIEGPIAVADPWGAHVEISAGQPIALFPLEGATGESIAVPMSWRKASADRDFVALKQDIDSLNDRVSTLETNVNTNSLIFNAHIHNTPATMGVPSGPPVPPPLPAPPPPMTPSVTAATIKGSDRHKVTHG